MSTNIREPSEFKDGIHYKIIEEGGRSYYLCLLCQRQFPRVYYTARLSSQRVYGTRQLMALWAWHNFVRHLEKCKVGLIHQAPTNRR